MDLLPQRAPIVPLGTTSLPDSSSTTKKSNSGLAASTPMSWAFTNLPGSYVSPRLSMKTTNGMSVNCLA